jgi:hypothetical protein
MASTCEQKALELLKRARPLLHASGPQATTAIYIPPAEAMRRAAEEMEAQDALIIEIDEFLRTKTTN